MIQCRNLDNGVTVLLETVAVSEVASVGFWFTNGSRDENADEQGYSHFLEHMLFKGTNERNAFKIASEIDRVGGILNAFTEKEACCYYCTVPKEHLPVAIELLSDIAFNSILDGKEIENEKRVIINEIQSYTDSPDEVAYESFLHELWDSHPLATKITGEVKDVMRIEGGRLVKFYRERYTLGSLVIAIAGNVLSEAAIELVQKNCDGKPRGSFVPERERPIRRKSWKYGTNRFNQIQVYTGIDSLPYQGLKSFYSILVFSTIFGESMSSRLYQEIREKLGLCYAIYAFRSYYTDVALWTIYSNTTPEMGEKLVESIGKTLASLFISHITPQELSDAKSHLKGSLILTQEETEVRMKRLFRLYNSHGQVLEFGESMRMIDDVILEEIEEIISKHITPDDFNLFAYGNKKSKKIERIRFNFNDG